QHAIMPHVGVRHEISVAAYSCASPAGRDAAPVDGDVFPDGAPFTDFDTCGFPPVLGLLRIPSDDGARTDAAARPDVHVALDHRVRSHPGAIAEPHTGTDHHERGDSDISAQLRALVDD